jgi:methionyl aminopeptidase
MDEEVYDKYIRAGKIASEARNSGAKLIKSGISFLDVANKVEAKILENGAGIAFPTNIAVNEIAAHYSPSHDDKLVFKKGDVVKLDVGAHIDGYIADTATTVEVETNNYSDIIKASEEGLKVAIEMMKPGVNLSKVGGAVSKAIGSYGFKPVDNLTGHGLQKFVLHSGVSVPSVPDPMITHKVKQGDVLAIEPFATNGAGHVTSGPGSNIFRCTNSIKSKFVRDNRAKLMHNKLVKSFKTLPFAERWTTNLFENNETILRRLSFLGMVKQYPQLIDAGKGIVTQKEHTVIITNDGCEVTT